METSHFSTLAAKNNITGDDYVDSGIEPSISPPAQSFEPESPFSISRRLQSIRPPVLGSSIRRMIDIAIIVLVVIISAIVWMRPELINLGGWGYLGAFVINTISTATILLPAPGIAAILSIADQYNPILLGIVTGFGGALGSLTAYWAGAQGQKIINGGRLHRFLVRLMERFGGLALFLFTFAFFMPADIASIVAGATNYPMRRYFVYVSAGHILKMILIFWALSKYWGSIETLF